MSWRQAILPAVVLVGAVLVVGSELAPVPAGTGPSFVEIAARVASMRGHVFEQLPDERLVPADEFARRARRNVTEDGGIGLDPRVLRLLGAVPPDFDLQRALLATAEREIAGVYLPRDGSIVVSGGVDPYRIEPLDELVLAHELAHALVDQHLGFPSASTLPTGRDGLLAVRSLVEGDAEAVMEQYADARLGVGERLLLEVELARRADGVDGERLPPFVSGYLRFPYEQGRAFVSALRERGGWAAVDRAYASPPGTTAEVLDPASYPLEVAPGVPMVNAHPGPPWVLRGRFGVGAADLWLLFGAPGGEAAMTLDDPRGAATLWHGGSGQLFSDGDREALALVLRTGRDRALCGPVGQWYRRSWPDAEPLPTAGGEVLALDTPVGVGVVSCDRDEVRVGMAPDLDTARRLSGTV